MAYGNYKSFFVNFPNIRILIRLNKCVGDFDKV